MNQHENDQLMYEETHTYKSFGLGTLMITLILTLVLVVVAYLWFVPDTFIDKYVGEFKKKGVLQVGIFAVLAFVLLYISAAVGSAA